MAGTIAPFWSEARRRVAAAWCLIGVLAVVLLPGVHGVELGWGAEADEAAAHACCDGHGCGGADGEQGEPGEERHEDGCPVCRVIYLVSAGGAPVFGDCVAFTGAAVRRAVMGSREEPAPARPMPQVMRRGPPVG